MLRVVLHCSKIIACPPSHVKRGKEEYGLNPAEEDSPESIAQLPRCPLFSQSRIPDEVQTVAKV
jgi:hypothetical protein